MECKLEAYKNMIEYLRIINSDHLTEILHVAPQIPKLTKAHTGDVDDA